MKPTITKTEELRAKQAEEQRLASMSAVQQLVHAAMHGETEVELTPEQSEQLTEPVVYLGYHELSMPKLALTDVTERPAPPKRCVWELVEWIDDQARMGLVELCDKDSTQPGRGAHAKTLANDGCNGVTY